MRGRRALICWGYSFAPHHYRKDGHWYWGASPSSKSVQRLKTRVGEIVHPYNNAPWGEVRGRLNRLLRGWASYFTYGTRLMAYRAADHHVYEAVRGFPARRHKVPTRGTRQFTRDAVFGKLGVLQLRRLHIGPPQVPSCVAAEQHDVAKPATVARQRKVVWSDMCPVRNSRLPIRTINHQPSQLIVDGRPSNSASSRPVLTSAPARSGGADAAREISLVRASNFG